MRGAALLLVAATLAACAREPEPPREPAAYPGQPVQTVVGTNYSAHTGLPTPPANAEGVVPPPPPRYMGQRTAASSANVGVPDVRRSLIECASRGPMPDVAHCE